LNQHDMQRIRENPLYTFKEGEYVAWRDREDIYRYGIIRQIISSTVSVNLQSIISTTYEVEIGLRYGNLRVMSVISLFKFSSKNEIDYEDNEEEEESESRMQQLLAGKK